MKKLQRGPQRPLTPEDLRDALAENNRDLIQHFDERYDKRFDGVDKRLDGIDHRFDRLETEMRSGFESVTKAIEETAQDHPTKGQVRTAFGRLSNKLKPHGIEVEAETLLPD